MRLSFLVLPCLLLLSGQVKGEKPAPFPPTERESKSLYKPAPYPATSGVIIGKATPGVVVTRPFTSSQPGQGSFPMLGTTAPHAGINLPQDKAPGYRGVRVQYQAPTSTLAPHVGSSGIINNCPPSG